jgi:hypothetical protein
VSTQVAGRLRIALIKVSANNATATLGSALEYMGLTTINVLNHWCGLEERVNR